MPYFIPAVQELFLLHDPPARSTHLSIRRGLYSNQHKERAPNKERTPNKERAPTLSEPDALKDLCAVLHSPPGS